MQLDDLTSAGFLRRWHLLDGQPRCPFDAVDPGLISEADRAAILAQNSEVRSALAAVEAYEAAAATATAEAPERYETIADPETGEESEHETAAYQAWRVAWETVATTQPETLALAIVRTGLDEEGNPRETDPMPEDTVEILPPVEPVPEKISDRQFGQMLAKLGVITQDEALAFVKRGEVPAALQAVIDSVEDPDARFDLDMAVSGATTFERSNPSTVALASALHWSPEQMDGLWRSAAAIP